MAPNSPDQIQNVSDTALMAAACRALETARADGLVHDPFAKDLLGRAAMRSCMASPAGS